MLSPAEKFQECCNPKCDSGQICHPDKDSYIVCRDCQAKTCIGCDVLWHSAQSCEEYQATTKDEQALRQMEAEKGQAFIDSKCKRCPKCDFAELKDGGCDHVVCKYAHVLFTLYCSQKRQAQTPNAAMSIAGAVLPTTMRYCERITLHTAQNALIIRRTSLIHQRIWSQRI